MNKRINVILPATTVSVLDRVTATGNRSALLARPIRHYVETQGRQNLRERLKQEALVNAERDLQMAAEWFPLEEEAWQESPKAGKERNSLSPSRRDLPSWLRPHRWARDPENSACGRHPERHLQPAQPDHHRGRHQFPVLRSAVPQRSADRA